MSAAPPLTGALLDPLGKGGLVGRLDPRTRVIAAVLFAVAAVSAQGLTAQGALLGLAAGLAGLARLPLGQTLRRLAALEGFMLAALFTLPFTVPGTPVATFLGWDASAEGLMRAASVALVATSVMLAVQALLGSLEAVALGHALERLRAPRRLVTLLLFTLRYIEVLHQEYARLRLAMRARAFRPRTGWHTWRAYGWLVGMLLVMSVERSERIHAAMRLRGFRGHYPALDHPRPSGLDWGFGAIHLSALVLFLALGMA